MFFVFLFIFTLGYFAANNLDEPWTITAWLIFIPVIILFILLLNGLNDLLKKHVKEYINYDKNSIKFFRGTIQQWEISKEEVEQIEYSTSFPLICYSIKIRCNEKKNYFKTRTIFTVYTLKKLEKKYGYPISKV